MDVSEAQVEQAKEDYARALEILKADRDAKALDAKRAVVGKCFKYLMEDPTGGPVYVAVIGLEADTGQLTSWHFQRTQSEQIEIKPDVDLEPGFLHEHCVAITRGEFVTAFNELLTAIAHYANRIPG
jgi:hypothetical protein